MNDVEVEDGPYVEIFDGPVEFCTRVLNGLEWPTVHCGQSARYVAAGVQTDGDVCSLCLTHAAELRAKSSSWIAWITTK